MLSLQGYVLFNVIIGEFFSVLGYFWRHNVSGQMCRQTAGLRPATMDGLGNRVG